MDKWCCLLPWVAPVEAFVGRVRLDLDLAPECSVGNTVVLTHPGCRPSPWFPAQLLQSDATNGNATVLYGWSSNIQDGWTRATAVPAGSLNFYACLHDEWRPDGERGRGYDYLPSCEATNCVTGCLVSDPLACNKSRMQLGEICSVPCERDGPVELPCDALAWPEQRSVECLSKVVYCDELGDVNQTACVDREGGTTSTTVPQSERYFNGCGELQVLATGVVGMPENQMVSGAYYLEVAVGNGEVAGFIDSSWSNTAEHQWLSTAGSGAGHIGLAVRFLSEDAAEIRFSWDGVWENGQQIQFSQYLVPVVFAEESVWRIPADAWLFLAPSIFYGPLTRRPFPNICHFPLDFEMAQPPVCRDELTALSSPEDCEEAAFHLGVLQEAIQGFFPGFPGECFICPECDNGDLFWNNATGADVTTETVRQAPTSGALCRRGNTENGSTQVSPRPTLWAEFYLAAGACPADYLQIFNISVCEEAALDLGLGFQTATAVSLPTVPSNGAVFWPAGCFYCPLCDRAHLFLNLNDPEEGNNTIELVSSTAPPQVNSATTTWLLCRSTTEQTMLTSTLSWQWTLPVTTTANRITADQTTAQETTVAESTTLPIATAGIVYLGDVQCDNPYKVAVQLQWWEDPNMLMLIGGGIALCGLASVCLWFWGICHRCCACLGRICCCCCMRRVEEPEDFRAPTPPPDELIFFNPPPGWKPTKVPGLVL